MALANHGTPFHVDVDAAFSETSLHKIPYVTVRRAVSRDAVLHVLRRAARCLRKLKLANIVFNPEPIVTENGRISSGKMRCGAITTRVTGREQSGERDGGKTAPGKPRGIQAPEHGGRNMHTHTHTHTHRDARRHTITHTHTHTDACRHTITHTHTHTHRCVQAHNYTHTHIHTGFCVQSWLWKLTTPEKIFLVVEELGPQGSCGSTAQSRIAGGCARTIMGGDVVMWVLSDVSGRVARETRQRSHRRVSGCLFSTGSSLCCTKAAVQCCPWS